MVSSAGEGGDLFYVTASNSSRLLHISQAVDPDNRRITGALCNYRMKVGRATDIQLRRLPVCNTCQLKLDMIEDGVQVEGFGG